MELLRFRVALPSQEVFLLGDSKPKINHHKDNSDKMGDYLPFIPTAFASDCSVWLNSCFLKGFCSSGSHLLILFQKHKINYLIKLIYSWLVLSVFKSCALSFHP